MRRDTNNYRLEIIFAVLALFGVFLVVVGAGLQDTVLSRAQNLVSSGATAAQTLGQRLDRFLMSQSVFNLLGIVLIVGAVVFLVWRARYRAIHSTHWAAKACPTCGSELTRVPRHTADRIVAVFLPVRRYACTNPACGWQGRRISRGKRRKDRTHSSR